MNQMCTNWSGLVGRLEALLSGCRAWDRERGALEIDAAFERWRTWGRQIREGRKTIYLVGNGASASMASHFSADLAKNGRLHTQVFSDLSLITAISNDLGYEWVFAEPLRRRAEAGDMLVAISSSGASPNVVKAAAVAHELGMQVVTLTAFTDANPLAALGDLNFFIAAGTYGDAETCHSTLLHHWMNLVQMDCPDE